MFEFLKLKKQEPHRTVVVALHGFGRRRTDEFLPLKNFLADKKIELILPELFNPRNPQDVDPQKWIQRAEEVVDELTAQNADVILIGFSMGGVIAAHLAAVKPVKKLILLAPAFNYINVGNAADLITGWFSSPNKKEQPDDYPPLPSDFTSVFMNVVDLLKQDAVLVECPVMILHGTEDETITVSSSRKIYKKIPAAQKGLILLEGVGHAILDDPAYASMALHTIAAFIDGQIHF